MQKINIYSLLLITHLILSQSGYAQNTKAQEIPLNQINKLNQQLNPQPYIQNTTCIDCQPLNELYKSCIQEVCPGENLVQYRSQKLKTHPEREKLTADLQKQLDAYAQSKLDDEIGNTESLVNFLKSGEKFNREDLKQIVLTFGALSYSYESQNYPDSIPKSIQDFLTEYLKGIQEIVQSNAVLSHARSVDPQIIYQEYYKQMSISEAASQSIQSEYQAVLKFIDSPIFASIRNHPFLTSSLSESKKEKDTALQNASFYDEASVMEHFIAEKSLKLVSDFLNSQVMKAAAEAVSLEDINRLMSSSGILQTAERYLAKLKDLKSAPSKARSYYESCIDNMTESVLFAPNNDQRRHYSQLLEKSKRTFKNKILSRLSSHTRATIEPDFNKIRIAAPRSPENIKRTIDASFKVSPPNPEQSDSDKEISKYVSVIGIFTLIDAQSDNFESTISREKGVLDFDCEEYSSHMIRDAAISIYSGIQTGWGSYHKPQEGEQILMHEMGHILSGLLADDSTSLNNNKTISSHSAQNYQNIISCLSEKQFDQDVEMTIQTQQGSIKSQKSRFAEEDYADLISALTSDPTSQNWTCAYIPKEQSAKNLFSHSEQKDDTHSSDLFRLFHFKSVNKTLPEPCSKYLSSIGVPDDFFKSCWPESETQ